MSRSKAEQVFDRLSHLLAAPLPSMRGPSAPRVLHCWHDFGSATCMLDRDHPGAHVPTADSAVTISFRSAGG